MAPAAAAAAGGQAPDRRLAGLAAAVDAVVAVGVDGLDEPAVRAELAAIETQARRLAARTSRLAQTLARRQAARLAGSRQGGSRPHDRRAGQRGERDVRQELCDQLGWTPSKAARTLRTGRKLRLAPATHAAFDAGRIDSDQARVIAETLQHLTGDLHDQVEVRLLDAAQDQHAVALGKTARRLLAEVDPQAALEDHDRRHARRWARITTTEAGMVAVHGELAGIDGEVAITAIDAFRVPDAPGEHRTPGQATADALAAALRAGLDRGAAPADHGVRPHVFVTVPHGLLAGGHGTAAGGTGGPGRGHTDQAGTGSGGDHDGGGDSGSGDTTPGGVAELARTGPIPAAEIRRLLGDATLTRIVVDAEGLPLDVSRSTRTVPVGVWKALVARDGGCTWPGCDAPPGWCDAAHLDRRWRDGAGVSAAELGLLCRPHHRHADRHRWAGRIVEGTVVWQPPAAQGQPHSSPPGTRTASRGARPPGSGTDPPPAPDPDPPVPDPDPTATSGTDPP